MKNPTDEKLKVLSEWFLDLRINNFLADYNSFLDGLNDELAGIEDMGLNKKATTLKDVKMEDLECDEVLFNEYHEIKELV